MARNILVVEDDRNISDLIRMYLDKEGFEVRIAYDGGKAVEEFEKQKPDLVLQMSGREEAQVFTENLRSLGLPVLTFQMDSFADMLAVTQALGRLTGLEDRTAALVRGWRARLEALRTGVQVAR